MKKDSIILKKEKKKKKRDGFGGVKKKYKKSTKLIHVHIVPGSGGERSSRQGSMLFLLSPLLSAVVKRRERGLQWSSLLEDVLISPNGMLSLRAASSPPGGYRIMNECT